MAHREDEAVDGLEKPAQLVRGGIEPDGHCTAACHLNPLDVPSCHIGPAKQQLVSASRGQRQGALCVVACRASTLSLTCPGSRGRAGSEFRSGAWWSCRPWGEGRGRRRHRASHQQCAAVRQSAPPGQRTPARPTQGATRESEPCSLCASCSWSQAGPTSTSALRSPEEDANTCRTSQCFP